MPKDTPGAASLPEGKAKVRLERDGSVLIVDEACTEPANPVSQVSFLIFSYCYKRDILAD